VRKTEKKALSPKRIAIFEPYYKFWGGAQNSILQFAEALRGRGYEVIFLFPEEGITVEMMREKGFFCSICRQGRAMDVFKEEVYALSPLSFPKLLLSLLLFDIRLSLLLRRKKVNFLILNTTRGTVIGGLAGRLAGVPSAAFLREFLPHFKGVMKKIIRLYLRTIPNVILTASNALLCSLPLPPSKPTAVIYAFPNLPTGVERREGKGDELLIGFAGNIEPHKGLHILLTALGKIRERLNDGNWRLDVAGGKTNEDYFRSLEEMIREMGIGERVRFLGWVEDMGGFLAKLDIFVLPSFTECFPRSVLEAMAMGVAVIGSDVGGVPELLGSAGVLVPPGDVDKLADAILGLGRDEEGRERLGRMGRERVERLFREEEQVAKLVGIIERWGRR